MVPRTHGTPGDREASQLLAQTLERQAIDQANGGQFGLAVATFRRAVALEPGRVRLHHNLAAALMDAGDLAGAEAAAVRALELEPNAADTQALLADVREKQSRR